MKYEHIAELLNGIADRFDWDKIMEGNNIIALKQVKWLNIWLHIFKSIIKKQLPFVFGDL